MCPYRRRSEYISCRDLIAKHQDQGYACPSYRLSRPFTNGINDSYYLFHHLLDPRFEDDLEAGVNLVSALPAWSVRHTGLAYVLLVTKLFKHPHGLYYLGIEGVSSALLIVVLLAYSEELIDDNLRHDLNFNAIVYEVDQKFVI